mgnify:CR=1 FL=1
MSFVFWSKFPSHFSYATRRYMFSAGWDLRIWKASGRPVKELVSSVSFECELAEAIGGSLLA